MVNLSIKTEWMPEPTRKVFEALAGETLMQGLILIGGTALSIQIGHRLSEDLDFWYPGNKMSKAKIDTILDTLRKSGFPNSLMTSAASISAAKINGLDILAHSRDHVVSGVKVTFFARDDVPYQYFSGLNRVVNSGTPFEIMDKDAIFEMKSWLITQRVRSRDLFDLMEMVRNQGKTIEDILESGLRADPSFSKEFAKSVLIGNVPLDKDDEGFESVQVKTDINAIYAFFKEAINQYETDVAIRLLKESGPKFKYK